MREELERMYHAGEEGWFTGTVVTFVRRSVNNTSPSALIIDLRKDDVLVSDHVWVNKCNSLTYKGTQGVRVGDTVRFYATPAQYDKCTQKSWEREESESVVSKQTNYSLCNIRRVRIIDRPPNKGVRRKIREIREKVKDEERRNAN